MKPGRNRRVHWSSSNGGLNGERARAMRALVVETIKLTVQIPQGKFAPADVDGPSLARRQAGDIRHRDETVIRRRHLEGLFGVVRRHESANLKSDLKQGNGRSGTRCTHTGRPIRPAAFFSRACPAV